MLKIKLWTIVSFTLFIAPEVFAQAQKPRLTLSEFFNAVQFRSVRVSPDGQAVVIETRRADWNENRFRTDLWLYRVGGRHAGSLVPLTTSGYDSDPRWSPDGRWIAFLHRARRHAARGGAGGKRKEQLDVISAHGGSPIALTRSLEAVHAVCWASDSHALYFATRIPMTREERAAYRKEWKDVIQYRTADRGDAIYAVSIPVARSFGPAGFAPQARLLAPIRYRVWYLSAAPDGRELAIATRPRSKHFESLKPFSIYLMDLPSGEIHLLSHTRTLYELIHWSQDSRHIFFWLEDGSVRGPYKDAQERVYWVNAKTGKITRWASKFFGSVNGYSVGPSDLLFGTGRLGTEVQIYSQTSPSAPFVKQTGLPGTYEDISAAAHSPHLAFVYSTLQDPAEVYLANSPAAIAQARPITSFNSQFTRVALPRGRTFRWKADDGVMIEGMLIYPPGKFGAKHLRMFTLIHGGPEEASGDHFEFDWYQWAALAATDGWLVFEPNYRGSTGYGDSFTLRIVPHIVSRPGKDILEGIDALVKQGIADPSHLTVGGYSYGGYMTDWLITQTTRFKAAVTGAGAIENAVNWGNDDLSFDDAYFLEGPPWASEKIYNQQAALWQINKVTTPTHIVAGADDIRVYVGEDYLLERCLHTLHVPEAMLLFPGEGHMLANNPWHGRIKVREELKWINKYGLH